MISICIPVYNLDVRQLAEALEKQAKNVSAEIILIDDGSQMQYRELNKEITGEVIQYHELEENIGRARIRNLFAGYAKYEHLLFMDCDSVIISECFLSDYSLALSSHPDQIICGGRIYDPVPPEGDRKLHWKYGTRKESQPVEIRKKDPNRSFMTNNFLIPIGILKDIPFNENLRMYGHEDSLFGYELAEKGHEIVHIDNPVLHGELQTNREFVDKTREAVQNLVFISEMLKDDPGFADSITLLRTARNLESRGVAGLIRIISVLSVPVAKMLLRLGWSSLKLLDIYKLGLFVILKRK
jgi:glycosyltransferase involved in cell wall biosynthesis